MRSGARSAALLLLVLGCAGLFASAQKTAQQGVTIVVLNASPNPPQPVKSVRVSLGYLDSSMLITDAQEVTNSQGQALLMVSAGVAQRGNLRIAIAGAGDLVIYQPADGQLPALPSTVNVKMLPKGSPLLLGTAQIEALLHRSALQVSLLQKQLAAQKQTAGLAQSQTPDLGAAIAQWAAANGFSADQVNEKVQQWAQDIESQSAQSTNDEKALAELALKHFANAAQLFNQASDADRKQINTEESQEQSLEAQEKALQAAQQVVLNKLRGPMRQLVDHSAQAATAFELNGQFHQATQALQSAEAAAETEYTKHSGDKGFQQLWLEALSNSANALWQEGKISPGKSSVPLLAQSADDFRTLSQQYSALGDLRNWAWEQEGLGIALANEAMRVGGARASALLSQAVEAYQQALQVFTKSTLPANWASTQIDLGSALLTEGERANNEESAALISQAVQAYQSAFEVDTKAGAPTAWADAQNDLGNALDDEGNRASGDKAASFFKQAVQAYQQALEVATKADAPHDWAMTENNLGIALKDEAQLATGDEAASLFGQAVKTFQDALQVFTKNDVPQEWAATENNLGIALKGEADAAGGDKAAALFNQASQAYDHAFEVLSKADLPAAWADTEFNVANVLLDEGERASGDKSAALFDQAVAGYRSALDILSKDDRPMQWAHVQFGLGTALLDRAQLESGGDLSSLLDQVIEAFQNALQIYSRDKQNRLWASSHSSLATAYKLEKKFDAAASEYQLALGADPDSASILKRASSLYHENLFQYDLALEEDQHRIQINPSAANRMDLVEADLTAGRFDDCIQHAGELAGNVLTPSQIVVRDTLTLACGWAAGDMTTSRASEEQLLSSADTMQKDAWSFTGTLHYLSAAPEFENGRGSWIALFSAVQNAESGAIASALQQLVPLMQN